MITVTLGTIPYPFDRAVNWVATLLESGIISESVIFQHGVTEAAVLKQYPQVTTFPIISSQELINFVRSSRLVISHAGQGSTRSLAAEKAAFILMPRLAYYGEHIDDHQLSFAQSVEPLGVKHCLSLESLKEVIENPPLPLTTPLFNHPKLADHLIKRYSPEISQKIFDVSKNKNYLPLLFARRKLANLGGE